jgi:linoleoyl-CoA desaturase
MGNTWAIHQLFTTTNFAPKNKIVNWYTGGLNHQIEHHIFPNISHIHYGNIAKIVKETAGIIYRITNTKQCAVRLSLTSNI